MAKVREKMVDKRIVERNLTRGLLSKQEYEEYLADLADCEGSYDRVEIDPGDLKAGSQSE
ncbi:MAG: hypothetical protein WBM46_16515 [Polyangiales bacterium]|jgi:hypothetical protein